MAHVKLDEHAEYDAAPLPSAVALYPNQDSANNVHVK